MCHVSGRLTPKMDAVKREKQQRLVIQAVTFLGWWVHATFWKGWKRDLQGSGMKRARLELPGGQFG